MPTGEATTQVDSFSEIQEELEKRARRIVWCTVATIDGKGRPRSRILHPNWEGSTAWILTGRHTLKTKHLASNPYVSLSYWDQQQEQIYADCKVEWEDDSTEMERVWNFFKANDSPYGYDGSIIWPDGVHSEGVGILRCTPWRIELASMTVDPPGFHSTVWRP